MSTPKNHNKPWDATAKAQLKTLAGGNTPTRVIGLKMGRSESSIYSQAASQGVSLKPTNQKPYNRQK